MVCNGAGSLLQTFCDNPFELSLKLSTKRVMDFRFAPFMLSHYVIKKKEKKKEKKKKSFVSFGEVTLRLTKHHENIPI